MTQPTKQSNLEDQAAKWLKEIVEAFGKKRETQVECDGIMAFGSVHLTCFANVRDERDALKAKVAELEAKITEMEKVVAKPVVEAVVADQTT